MTSDQSSPFLIMASPPELHVPDGISRHDLDLLMSLCEELLIPPDWSGTAEDRRAKVLDLMRLAILRFEDTWFAEGLQDVTAFLSSLDKESAWVGGAEIERLKVVNYAVAVWMRDVAVPWLLEAGLLVMDGWYMKPVEDKQ